MIPYLIFFLTSILFCYEGELLYRNSISFVENNAAGKSLRKIKKHGLISIPRFKRIRIQISYVYFAISVLIVSALAGMRGYSIGTDIQVYGNSLFAYARTVTLVDFIRKLPNIEPLYLALVDFSALFSSEAHILYFFTGLVIYSFIMCGIVAHGKTIPITLSWVGFLLLLYGDTYNAMRQCLGIAIAFWGFHFFKNKQYLRLILSLAVAYFFHNSSIIMIAIIGIYYILQLNNRMWIKVLMIIGTIGVVYYFNDLLSTFVNIGTLNSKMMRYQIEENSGISVPAILIRLPFLFAILLQRNRFANNYNRSWRLLPLKNMAEADFYIILLLLEIFTVELSAFVASLYRISLYFVPFRFLSYARIVSEKKKKNRTVYLIVLIIYLAIIFIYQNVIKGNNEIYPYVFWFMTN